MINLFIYSQNTNYASESKKAGKDQESIQSSTTSDQVHPMGK